MKTTNRGKNAVDSLRRRRLLVGGCWSGGGRRRERRADQLESAILIGRCRRPTVGDVTWAAPSVPVLRRLSARFSPIFQHLSSWEHLHDVFRAKFHVMTIPFPRFEAEHQSIFLDSVAISGCVLRVFCLKSSNENVGRL